MPCPMCVSSSRHHHFPPHDAIAPPVARKPHTPAPRFLIDQHTTRTSCNSVSPAIFITSTRFRIAGRRDSIRRGAMGRRRHGAAIGGPS
uniref:Uncharacterized protein n=1 Tax=Arundo donax TaxID=35708 RepID=A0A0A9B6E8_ARUDO